MSKFLGLVGVIALSFGLMIGCTKKNPVSQNEVVSLAFNVSGKILGKDGNGVSGAKAYLVKSGLYAITGADGSYNIVGKGEVTRSYGSGDTSDTLVVAVPNESGSKNTSEVVKQVVNSGVIMVIPETYIVQREIRGYLAPDDVARVGNIEAVLYDVSFPEQQKHITLWHDTLNKAFHSFAYFSSALNKNYTLFVKVYDKQNRFIGRSENFTFPDQAGNIVFANAFQFDNATPMVYSTPVSLSGDSSIVTVTATDAFGGEISNCKIDINGSGNYINVIKTLSRSTDSIDTYTGTAKIPVALFDPLKAVVVAEDNDGNISTNGIAVEQEVVLPELKIGHITVSDYIVLTGLMLSTVTWRIDNIGEWKSYSNNDGKGLVIPWPTTGTHTCIFKIVTHGYKDSYYTIEQPVLPELTIGHMVFGDAIILTGLMFPTTVTYQIDNTGEWISYKADITLVIPWPTTSGKHICTFKIITKGYKDALYTIEHITE